jgi:peptidoglycan/xylan/chitin deacetylase (PgdA/CDA1 family)
MSARQSRMLHDRPNLRRVNWSVDPQDWPRPGASIVAPRMIDGARPGAIILAHDTQAATVTAVPEAISGHWGLVASQTDHLARPLPRRHSAGAGFSG